jgi:hypothetical protein
MAKASEKKTTLPKPTSTPLVAVYKEKPDLRKKAPPLINLQVTNPIIYLERWWKKVISGEGIDFRVRVHPLTAIAVTIIMATFGFGVGRFVLVSQRPYIKYVPTPTASPMPSPNPWRETALVGTLQFSAMTNRYYLLTTSAEVVMLEVPDNVVLKTLIGRRILASGNYHDSTRTLRVTGAEDLEVLPKKVESVPMVTPVPNPSLLPEPEM